MYQAIVCPITSLEPIKGADKIQLARVSGHQIIVGMDACIGAMGCFFPVDGQLSDEFCMAANLYRKHPLTDEPMGGYFESNRRVKSMRMKGEISEGFWVPMTTMSWTGPCTLQPGTTFTEINGIPICNKYVTPATKAALRKEKNHLARMGPHVDCSALKEHFETGQFRYESGKIQPGSRIIISQKLHGTSGRTGNLPIDYEIVGWQRYWNRFATWAGLPIFNGIKYQIVSGTRRTIERPDALHPNATPNYRQVIHQELKTRGLWQGETLYYEIVGFTENGGSIQPAHHLNPKTDKDLIKKYGSDTLSYHYGCRREPDPTRTTQFGWMYDIYVYRITLRAPDGNILELTDEQMRLRCKDLGIKSVPMSYFIESWDPDLDLAALCKTASEEAQHDATEPAISEGVVLRVEGKRNLTLKYKSAMFCMLEGLKKNDDTFVDIEEAS